MDSSEGAAVAITAEDNYRVLLQVRDDVQSLLQRSRTFEDRITDHEGRLREIEAHGSINAQELSAEMQRTRGRLHTLEGGAGVQTVLNAELVEHVKKAATKESVDSLEESVKATRGTLLKLAFLALTVALTALATFLVAAAT